MNRLVGNKPIEVKRAEDIFKNLIRRNSLRLLLVAQLEVLATLDNSLLLERA